jgi:hypothetical protein
LIFAYAALGLWAHECSRSHRASRGGALVTSVLETSMLRVAEALPGWLVPIVALLVVGVAFLPLVWQSRRSEPDWSELHRLPTPWRV